MKTIKVNGSILFPLLLALALLQAFMLFNAPPDEAKSAPKPKTSQASKA